jgi:hypothetical protein
MKGMPKTLGILRALTALIEGVTHGNGYEYDLRGAVFRGRTRFGAETRLPCVSLLEAPQTEDQAILFAGELGRHTVTPWLLLVQGFVAQDPAHPTDPAYPLMAAVTHRLSRAVATKGNGQPVDPDNYLLGRRVSNVNLRAGVVSGPREGISDHAFFYLPLVVEYPHDPEHPFEE